MAHKYLTQEMFGEGKNTRGSPQYSGFFPFLPGPDARIVVEFW